MQQQHDQNLSLSAQGYSPEYSSPMSQQSGVLQARFNQLNILEMTQENHTKNSLPLYKEEDFQS